MWGRRDIGGNGGSFGPAVTYSANDRLVLQ
jgi:hypothetical protein